MPKQAKMTDEKLLLDIYALLGLEPSPTRAHGRITVILEAGKAVRVTEEFLPIFEVPDPAVQPQENKAKEG